MKLFELGKDEGGCDTVIVSYDKALEPLVKAARYGGLCEGADSQLRGNNIALTRLRADLQLAAETLRRYEALHLEKAAKTATTPQIERQEAARKAEVNATLAARFEQTLKETE